MMDDNEIVALEDLTWERIEQIAMVNPIAFKAMTMHRNGEISREQALIFMVLAFRQLWGRLLEDAIEKEIKADTPIRVLATDDPAG